jgi:hypothetical protein
MGSTHPPLESLLTFSQKCFEGFELSRLNRISILRNDFLEIFEERVECEIDARLARWIFEARQAIGAGCVPDQTNVPELLPPGFASEALPHGAGDLVPPEDDRLALGFSFDSMFEFRDREDLGMRLPFRRVPVSQDASAALRSLEHFARCKIGSLGDNSIDALNCYAPGSLPRCPLLRFPEPDAMRASRRIVSPMSHALSSTIQSERCTVRRASVVPVTAQAISVAQPGSHLIQRPRRRSTTSLGRRLFVANSTRSHFPSVSAVCVSLRASSVRRTAVLLGN